MYKTQPTWFPINWLKSTVPVLTALSSPGEYDVCGSLFFVKYNGVVYAVTATHVLEVIKNPMIGFPTHSKTLRQMSSETLKTIGTKWIDHPNDSMDISAIPIRIDESFMDVQVIEEQYWNSPTSISGSEEVLHLGYPDKIGASYADGSMGYFPISMSGKILKNTDGKILTQTLGHHGASGGPLFLQRKSGYPQVIGVAVIAKKDRIYGNYLDKTEFTPTSNIVEILESENMKTQVQNLKDMKYL